MQWNTYCFFFQEGDFESGNLQVTWFFIMQNQNSSWSTTKIGFGNQREREHKFLDLKKPNGVDKTFFGLDFCFQRKNFSGTMGFCFQWTKCCGFFFFSGQNVVGFFSTQNELLVVPNTTHRNKSPLQHTEFFLQCVRGKQDEEAHRSYS